MKNKREVSTQELEKILQAYMTGQEKYPGEEIAEICEVLAERVPSKTDATGIYRHYLGIFFSSEIKNDL